MGRRSSEEAENHWPGFVDALSTIVMVVTFLLIILSIAIFAMSQNIAKSYVESQARIAERGGGDMFNKDNKSASRDFHSSKETQTPEDKNAPAKSQAAIAALSEDEDADAESEAETETETTTETTQESSAKSSSKKSSSSKIKAELAEELKAEQDIETDQNLAVLSRKTDIDEKRIVVAAAEKSDKAKEVRVLKSASILTLQFDKASVTIDEGSSTRVSEFVKSKESLNADTKLTIWSFTGAQTSSISEAKRIAYYRALAARNELINNGFGQKNIAVEIRFGNSTQTHDTVQIVVTH